MEDRIIQLGRDLIPLGDVVWVEPGDPTKQREDFKSDKPYRSRVILISKNETHLCELLPEDFINRDNFRFLVVEQIAINPAISFRVETYVPSGLQTAKEFKTRLKWRDTDGEWQSKLLQSDPEIVAATVLRTANRRPKTTRPMSRKRLAIVTNAHS
jgi:hypothetical protein